MKTLRGSAAVLAAAVAASLAVSTVAEAKTIVLRLGSGHPSKPTPYVRNMEHYLADEIKKRVEGETEHKVRIIHAYAGKIAKVHETLEAVEKGLLDIGGWCVCFESAKMLPMNFDYFTPFTTGDIRRQLEVKLRVMAEHPDCRAAELARHICHAAERFERDNPDPGDDKTVVVIRATEP